MQLKNFNKLKPYEALLQLVITTSTMRSQSPTTLDMLYDIYENETGIAKHRNYTCSRCQLDITRLVANLYFEHKKQVETLKNGKKQ